MHFSFECSQESTRSTGQYILVADAIHDLKTFRAE